MIFKILSSLVFLMVLVLLFQLSEGGFQWAIQLFIVLVLFVFMIFFLSSLRANKTPIITRYALLMGAEESVEELSYTRKVTWVWVLFLMALLILKSQTFLGSQSITGLGFVELTFYIGSGVLFVGEFYIRSWFLPAHRGGSLWSFLKQLSQISFKEVWLFDVDKQSLK